MAEAPESGSSRGADGSGTDLESLVDADVALVEIEPGLAVLYGSHVPAGLEPLQLNLLDSQSMESMAGGIAMAVGLANIGAQAVNGAMQVQGLVRLAPQTIEAMKAATPVVKEGWNLGTLVSNGKFAHQVRWLPATGAQGAGIAAAVGPGLALLAIQFQLASIERLAKHNVLLTTMVLEEGRIQRRANVTGLYATLRGEFEHAKAVGAVTDEIFNEVKGQQHATRSHLDEGRELLQNHLRQLRSNTAHQDQRQYLLDHGEAILADAHVLLTAQASAFLYSALRAGNLVTHAVDDPRAEALLTRVVEQARQENDEVLSEIDGLLDAFVREFHILTELDGNRAVKFGGASRARKDVVRVAQELQKSLAGVRGSDAVRLPGALLLPDFRVFRSAVPNVLLEILPLRLRVGEQVLGLADVAVDRGRREVSDAGWVVVTDQRVLILKQSRFKRHGTVDIELATTEIAEVAWDRNAGEILLTAGDKPMKLVLRKWAKEAPETFHVPGFVHLLENGIDDSKSVAELR